MAKSSKIKGILAPRDLCGIVLLCVGLQLRAVETFELSPDTTQFLNGTLGPSTESPRGALRQFVIESTQHRHRITPPAWLGWSCLSAGGVMVTLRMLPKK